MIEPQSIMAGFVLLLIAGMLLVLAIDEARRSDASLAYVCCAVITILLAVGIAMSPDAREAMVDHVGAALSSPAVGQHMCGPIVVHQRKEWRT